MKTLRHALTRAHLLNKRILKQPVFLVLLALIPLLVAGVNLSADHSSSLVRAAVAPGSPGDATAQAVIEALAADSSAAVQYIPCRSAKEVQKVVSSEDARIGFVFPKNLDELFEAYGAQETASMNQGAISMISSLFAGGSTDMTDRQIICYTATNDVISKLTREQFFSKLYRDLETAVLKVWLRSHPEIGTSSASERDAYAERIRSSRDFYSYFDLEYLNGDQITSDETSRYISSPMRGLLAVLLTLTALSAVLSLCDDIQNRRFVWISSRRRSLFYLGCILLPMADLGLASYIALYVSGTFTSWKTELPCMLLFLLCAAGFANLLRVILRKMSFIAASVPIVLCACLFLTPVFADMTFLPHVQICLPTYLYLNSIHGSSPLWQMALYAAVTILLSLLPGREQKG